MSILELNNICAKICLTKTEVSIYETDSYCVLQWRKESKRSQNYWKVALIVRRA